MNGPVKKIRNGYHLKILSNNDDMSVPDTAGPVDLEISRLIDQKNYWQNLVTYPAHPCQHYLDQ